MNFEETLFSAEKLLIVRVHAYFTKEKEEKRAGTQRKVRDRVAESTGFSKSTISEVILH